MSRGDAVVFDFGGDFRLIESESDSKAVTFYCPDCGCLLDEDDYGGWCPGCSRHISWARLAQHDDSQEER